jgi:transcriptional regulator GlxA family with amidase domain
VRILPERGYDEVPDPWGFVIPGGVLGPIRAMVDEPLMAWVRRAAEGAELVASVCTGALVLAAAGLLDGKRATTYWSYVDRLANFGAIPVRERWVRDGKVTTAAGVSAGIDMALDLVARLTDETTARMIQVMIEYDPAPPLGPIPWGELDLSGLGVVFEKLGGGQVPKILAGRPDLLEKILP